MVALLTASVFAVLCLLHLQWAFGGRTAYSGVPEEDGQPLFTPSRPATPFVAALLRSIGDFRYVGFFKRARGSRFAELDTRFYSPLCLPLALATAWVALDLA